MPAQVMSFPFRIAATGLVATVEHGSDDEVAELLAIGSLTVPGERIQAPTFGCNDPAFAGFETANLQRHVLDFGPPDITIIKVGATKRGDDREEMAIEWQRTGGEVR